MEKINIDIFNNLDNFLFYDIEIFKHNALVIFKNINKKVVKYFHNDFKGLFDFIKNKVLVGYNNYHYDDIILTAMLEQKTPEQLKMLNDRIISGENKKESKLPSITLDCFQQIAINNPSLKYIEGNMGKMILESSVPFDIDRMLTDDEFLDVYKYCSYDIDTTIDVFKLRLDSYFKTKIKLVEMLKNDKALKWNTTTISASLLTKKPTPKWANIRNIEEFLHVVPSEVKDMWFDGAKAFNCDYKKEHKVNLYNNELVFGFGGLHGAPQSVVKTKNIILLDVASMYPNIIINIQALSENTDKYKSILNRRLEVKHKDKNESDALKLILNSVYGNLNNKYSKLHNPKASMSVCIYGQIALFDLCHRLSDTCDFVNINTDGVAFTTDSEKYKEVIIEWEKDHKLKLEEDKFDLLIQRDVNNYIAVKDGKVAKVKGGDVKRYNKDFYFDNNSCRIIDICIVDYLVYGKDVLENIVEHLNEPYLFQFILKAGSTYKGTVDGESNMCQKVNRVFACKDKGVSLYKLRADDGLVRFADTPENMRIYNEDCSNIADFKEWLDIDFYYQLIMRKLEAWL